MGTYKRAAEHQRGGPNLHSTVHHHQYIHIGKLDEYKILTHSKAMAFLSFFMRKTAAWGTLTLKIVTLFGTRSQRRSARFRSQICRAVLGRNLPAKNFVTSHLPEQKNTSNTISGVSCLAGGAACVLNLPLHPEGFRVHEESPLPMWQGVIMLASPLFLGAV